MRPPRLPTSWIVLPLLVGCAVGGEEGPWRPGASAAPEAEPMSLAEAEERYGELCASCHGPIGEGGVGPRLIDHPDDRDTLAEAIDRTMPQDDVAACEGRCADGVARFILERLTSEALRCDAVPPGPRRLRMLNRREYANSLRDLLGLDAGAAPSCEPTTFRYVGSHASVHVAGSFNGWDPTAWPMTFDGSAWTLTRALPVGTHEYKLVLDGGTWIADPANPDTVDDGYGGRNSLLRVDCDASAAPEGAPDLAADLPVEPRPEGYAFDNSADALRMTSVYLDELLRAGEVALDAAGSARLNETAACGSEPRGACAARFVRAFGRRAFRRPLTDEEAGRYEALAAEAPSLEEGLRAVALGMLVSPSFLYRSELGESVDEDTYRLTPYEVATALGYGLWASTPDDALLDAAERGELSDAASIEAQARRMIDDPRARPVLAAFARQWLGIEGVPQATKTDAAFDRALGRSMIAETEAFFLHVTYEGTGSFDELLTGDVSFVDARLARLYGVDGVSAEQPVAVESPPERAAGLLGHASLLTSTAHSDQTSPIRRGLLVRRRLLCQSFGQPPPNAGGVPDVDPSATTRERFRQHTDDAACASCHRYIDPIGFGFEPFGPIGEHRTMENGRPVETTGNMNDVEYMGAGTDAEFSSLPELGRVLADSEAAPACFATQAYRFARGAETSLADRCALMDLQRRFEEGGRDIRELFVATFLTDDFLLRRADR